MGRKYLNRRPTGLAIRGEPLLGVARGLLQERPLQFQHRNVRVKSWPNPCPTLGQLLASRILYKLLLGVQQYEITQARLCTQRCSKVGQLLVNSSPTPDPMGSCRGLTCSSPLATPDACRSPFTKMTEITKTTETTKMTKTTQTATNKELSAGFAEITETTTMTKTKQIQGANHGFPKPPV